MYIKFKCIINNNHIFISHRSLNLYFYINLSSKSHYILPCDDANDFTDDVLQDVLARMKVDKDYKKATEDTDITKPLKKWIQFWELFAALIPLTYHIHEHNEATPEHLVADYASTQERLIATTSLNGPHFELDNRTLYDEFKPLVVDGPGWSFIKKKYDKVKDGSRGAVLVLKSQAECTSVKLMHKQGASTSIANSACLGPRKGFTFANLCHFASGCTQ